MIIIPIVLNKFSIILVIFSNNHFLKQKIILNLRRHSEDYLNDANTLVQFGWKKEAIPITRENKSFIARESLRKSLNK